MGVQLHGETIRQTLAQADQKAQSSGSDHFDELPQRQWASTVVGLQVPSVPRTYLAIYAVGLVARCMHDREELSVWDIKTGTSARGYSASSIGSALSTFAKSHDIDLRAHSSQPLNNQPFTFKDRILRDPNEMNVASRHTESWLKFITAMQRVDDATPESAAIGLSVLFALARRTSPRGQSSEVMLNAMGTATLANLEETISMFVSRNPDGGRTGQAFTAALLDLVYGVENVRLGHINDPDSGSVGDVHVTESDDIWLWTEVKQRVITTGDVTNFAGLVAAEGGSRAIYCAFVNSEYPDHVSKRRLAHLSSSQGVVIEYFDSPNEFMVHIFRVAPGSTRALADRFVRALFRRLLDAECAPKTTANLHKMLIADGIELTEAIDAHDND